MNYPILAGKARFSFEFSDLSSPSQAPADMPICQRQRKRLDSVEGVRS